MLLHHCVDGIPYSLEERRFKRTMRIHRPLKSVYVRKKNLLLLLHVHDHLVANLREELSDLREFRMIGSVSGDDVVRQGSCARYRLADVTMVLLANMPC